MNEIEVSDFAHRGLNPVASQCNAEFGNVIFCYIVKFCGVTRLELVMKMGSF